MTKQERIREFADLGAALICAAEPWDEEAEDTQSAMFHHAAKLFSKSELDQLEDDSVDMTVAEWVGKFYSAYCDKVNAS